jgi:hypothetical protein
VKLRKALISDIRIESWSELHEQLFRDSWKPDLGRFRSNYAFRGMMDVNGDLRTSLICLGGEYEALETDLLRNFRKYAERDVVREDSVWNWLAVARHHGLPTRLLDWTFSPYVALHFVTAETDRFIEDGVVWCVDYVKCQQHLPKKLKQILCDEGSSVFTVEMLNRAATTLQDFDQLSKKAFVVFLEPPSLDARIVNQFALFSLMSDPSAVFDEWLLSHPDYFRRLIIPAELKWEIRDKLDQANITERVLFPGLDGLSLWLTRHYSPREPKPKRPARA